MFSLTAVVLCSLDCGTGQTEVTSRWQFAIDVNCSSLIGSLGDVYSEGYRYECQYWMGLLVLPDHVSKAYVSECFDLANNTAKYRAEICCEGG